MGLRDFDKQWDFIMAESPFSDEFTLICEGSRFPVRGMVSIGWEHSEVDGKFMVEKPDKIASVLVARSAIPPEIPEAKFGLLDIEVDGKLYTVRPGSFEGESIVRFFMKPLGEDGPDDDGPIDDGPVE